MIEIGVLLPIINLDYKIKNRKNSKESSIYDVVGYEDSQFSKIHNQDLVYRLMNILDENEQLILTLYYFEEYTYIEIGKMLHMNKRTVSKKVAKSLNKMKIEFEEGNGNVYAII